ncbi:MAG: hypothetical protein RLZZ413_59, partial [Pseudomonadota bacterium]
MLFPGWARKPPCQVKIPGTDRTDGDMPLTVFPVRHP